MTSRHQNPFAPPLSEVSAPSPTRPLYQTMLGWVEIALGTAVALFGVYVFVDFFVTPPARGADKKEFAAVAGGAFVVIALVVFLLPGWALLRSIRWPQLLPGAWAVLMLVSFLAALTDT